MRETGSRFRRAFNMTLFVLHVFWHALRHRYDLVWTASLPPVLNGAAGRIIGWLTGARFLYHVQDVYPEAAVTAGQLREGRLERRLKRLDAWTCRKADIVVTLSSDMRDTIAGRAKASNPRIELINNFVLSDLEPPAMEEPSAGAPFTAIFTGNIGRFQGLDQLVGAMREMRDEAVGLELIGSGVAVDGLKAQVSEHELGNVTFTPRMSAQEAFERTCRADIGIISLIPGMYRVSYPSKLMTYLAAGLPVLAIVEKRSAVAKYVRENEAGLATDPDPESIARALRKAAELFPRDPQRRERLRALANKDFGTSHTVARWLALTEGS